MKACLYSENAQPVEPIDDHKLAVADKKPEKVEAPRQGYYIVNYTVLKGATLIAFIIMLVWLAALWAF